MEASEQEMSKAISLAPASFSLLPPYRLYTGRYPQLRSEKRKPTRHLRVRDAVRAAYESNAHWYLIFRGRHEVWSSDHEIAARAALRSPADVDLREALKPFVALSDKRDAQYRKRGGRPESFPDSHPSYDISAHDLPIGVWRKARKALSSGESQ